MIIKEKDLEALREKHKNERIVFCSGNFDLTHLGHILFFEDCKSQGDILVVGIGSDEILRINKRDREPILSEKIRLKTVNSLKQVDYALIDYVSSKENLLRLLEIIFERLKPDYYVINEDAFNLSYRRELSNKFGVKLIILKREAPEEFEGISTTKIIDKIRKCQNN